MDDIDKATDLAQVGVDAALKRHREEVLKMPKGEPGDCDLCGEWSGRLVGGACAPCRDKHNLP